MKPFIIPLALMLAIDSAPAQDQAMAQRSTLGNAWWGSGSINGSVSTTGDVVSGDFSALVPLHSTLGQAGTLSGTVVFAEPYGQWVEQGGTQAGLGFGFRHLFGTQPLSALTQPQGSGFLDEGFYIGANISFDMADARFDQRFWQMGIGAEIGTRYLELRGRYLVPLGDGEESVERYSYSNSFRYSSPNFEVYSSYSFETILTYLTESLEGCDLTASVLIPGLDRWMEARVIGGYARFYSPTFDSIDYDSWRCGVEVRPVPAIVLGATWFENEALVGDNWLFSIGFQLPFETADIGDGKGGFWGHIKDAFKPKRRHLAERLREPTRRYALPMQIGTGLKSYESKFSYEHHVSYILPDGTVVTVVDESESASYSAGTTGSTSYSIIGSTMDVGATARAGTSITTETSATSGTITFANIETGNGSTTDTGTGSTTTGGTITMGDASNAASWTNLGHSNFDDYTYYSYSSAVLSWDASLFLSNQGQGTAPNGQTSSPP